jgi:hypothetical protein
MSQTAADIVSVEAAKNQQMPRAPRKESLPTFCPSGDQRQCNECAD